VENLAQLEECLAEKTDRVLLDNFSVDALSEAVKLRNKQAPGVALEASGGITLANVRDVAESGVDFISIGALTKDIQAIDLSMRFTFAD